MKFTVTYRGRDGALSETEVEAADRVACVAECRRRGIAPMGIREGERGKGAVSPKGARSQDAHATKHHIDSRRQALRISGVLGAFVVLALGIWWWMAAREDARPPEDPPTEQPKADNRPEARPSVPDTQPQEPTSAPPATNDVMLVDPGKDPNDPANRIKRETYVCRTNRIGKIITDYATEDGKTHMVIGYIEPKVEMSAADQLLAMATSSSGGGGIAPPMPGVGMSTRAFREAVEKPVEIGEDDSAEVRAMKERVNANRVEALALLDSGVSAAQIFEEHQRLSLENDQIRVKCQKELDGLVKSGDEEGARKYLATMSAALQQMGIAPLKMPMTESEREELNARRMAIKEEILKRKESERQDKQE